MALACGPASSVDRAAVSSDAAAGTPINPGGPRGPAVDRKGALDGVRCVMSGECRSGRCVDGFCCDSACTGPCLACDRPEQEGRCSPVSDGQDPDNDCSEEPAASCGRDGACDGAGACRKYKMGTQCAPGSCKGATESAASTCDGKGMCQPGATKSCAPAVCIEDSCGAPCATDPDCQEGFFCDSGTCRTQRAQAAVCERAAQCATGFCADGVCCATACTEKCYSCNLAASVGSCMPAPERQDPRRECLVQPTETCGKSGGCDGRGACRLHVQGAPCGYGTCTGSTLVGPSTCDGMGACKPGPSKDCAPFVCNGMVCWNACATNDQCKSGRTCRINTCQ